MFNFQRLGLIVLLVLRATYINAKAFCSPVTFQVDATAENTKFIAAPDPNNETAILAFFSNATANGADGTQTAGGHFTIHGTYCSPALPCRNVLQILIHGTTYNKTYWTGFNLGKTYDYPAFANAHGYHTLALDRLGHGDNIQHPDPIIYVQAPLHLEIIHQIITSIRTGHSSLNKVFDKIVYVGHSYGSLLGTGLAALHPSDSDAVVLTGAGTAYAPTAIALVSDIASARDVFPRFASLVAGYLTLQHEATIQATFFSGAYDPNVPAVNFAFEDTVTPGELLVNEYATTPAVGFENPVLLINGMNDSLLCNANVGPCVQILEGYRSLFPNASRFDTYSPPETGHDVNLHFSAPKTNAVIHNWLNQFF
jgi:pimeloyl-ACP methyl ester carboxylesterase